MLSHTFRIMNQNPQSLIPWELVVKSQMDDFQDGNKLAVHNEDQVKYQGGTSWLSLRPFEFHRLCSRALEFLTLQLFVDSQQIVHVIHSDDTVIWRIWPHGSWFLGGVRCHLCRQQMRADQI